MQTAVSNLKAAIKYALENKIPEVKTKLDSVCNTGRMVKLLDKHKGKSSKKTNFTHPLVFGEFTLLCEHTFKMQWRSRECIFWHLLLALLWSIGARPSSLFVAMIGEVATI